MYCLAQWNINEISAYCSGAVYSAFEYEFDQT